MTDPSTALQAEPAPPQAPDAGPEVVSETAPEAAPETAEATCEVAGERLEIPVGAAKSVIDPSVPVPSRIFFATIATVSLVGDLASKAWAEKRLSDYSTIEVIKNYFSFSLAKNRGGAWGVFQNQPEDQRRAFFLVVSGMAILFIAAMYRRAHPHQKALKWGLPLVLGGALGNVFDRIRYGHVIDFIDFYIVQNGQARHWPTFNVADMCICIGVVLMAIDMLFTKKRPLVAPPASSHAA
jgi:signal peptidase II